jgi:hypothetical protein
MTGHPLDVDLADLADGILDDAQAAELEAHLVECLLCRVKRQRLRRAPPAGLTSGEDLPSVRFAAPTAATGAEPAGGELWRVDAGLDERMIVLVLRAPVEDRVLAAPVTFDVEAADDETVVVDAAASPLGLPLAVYPRLATEVPRRVLDGRLATGSGLGFADELAGRRGPAIVDASDPRLEVRQYLADRLGQLDEQLPDPGTAADAPPPRPEHLRSSLLDDLRLLRGDVCRARPLYGWADVVRAEESGWEPIAVLDEVGIVLVVFDTPHGLTDEGDFEAARSVLTRLNATAVVVLASAVSERAEVFDAPALHHGIDAPSGRRTPPRPLIANLSAFDAISKYLDQSTGARAAAPPSRGPVTRVDVDGILRDAAATSLADAARQASRFKIAPKRAGYQAAAADTERLQAALLRAFGRGSVAEAILQPEVQPEDGEDGEDREGQ